MTRKVGFSPLEAAVYTRLTTHASTSSYSVYSHVPPNASPPYIKIGGFSGTRSESFGNRDEDVEDNMFALDIWGDSEHMGNKQVAEMMNNATIAITSSDLSITGYDAPPRCLLDFSEIMLDETEPSEPIYHGILRFRLDMNPS